MAGLLFYKKIEGPGRLLNSSVFFSFIYFHFQGCDGARHGRVSSHMKGRGSFLIVVFIIIFFVFKLSNLLSRGAMGPGMGGSAVQLLGVEGSQRFATQPTSQTAVLGSVAVLPCRWGMV